LQPRGFSADMQHLSAGAFGDFESMKNTSRVLAECSVDDDLDEKAEMRRLGVLIFEDLMIELYNDGDEYNFFNAFVAARSDLFVSVFGGHADFCLHFPGTHIIYKSSLEVMGFTLNGQHKTFDPEMFYKNLFDGVLRPCLFPHEFRFVFPHYVVCRRA
jgi:hypothetical protein